MVLNNYNNKSVTISKEISDIFENLPNVKKFEKNEIIYHQGDNANFFYYLKKGKVKVFMTSFNGEEKTINISCKGELLGEGAFFDRQPRVSSASAVTSAELVVIDKKMLYDFFKQKPQLAFDLLEVLAARIRLLSSQLDSMTFMQADARISKLLLENANNKKVKLTHEEIATAVGVSRITVSKTLSKFSKNNLISTHYGEIEILNENLLEEIVQN